MQNRQTGRRRRGGSGNQPRPLNQPMVTQGSNRLENRVRGNASQLMEKYRQMAREAHQAGDRVAAEYYLQHVEHYFRVLNDARIRQEEMRVRRGSFDPVEDEFDEDMEVRTTVAPPLGDEPISDRIVRGANGHPARAEGTPSFAEDEQVPGADPDPPHLSDGEAALAPFGTAYAEEGAAAATAPLGETSDPAAEGEPLRPARRRGRPRRSPTPAADG